MRTTSTGPNLAPSSDDWSARHREWQRRLPRLRLGAEPVVDQVERLRRATVVLSVVAGGIGLMFLALFSAFGAPVLGLAIGGVLCGVVLIPAWGAFQRTRALSARYLDECRESGGGTPVGEAIEGRPPGD